MFQSYARGAKEKQSIEEYLDIMNRRTELQSICSQMFSPLMTMLQVHRRLQLPAAVTAAITAAIGHWLTMRCVVVQQAAKLGEIVTTGSLLSSGVLSNVVEAQTLSG